MHTKYLNGILGLLAVTAAASTSHAALRGWVMGNNEFAYTGQVVDENLGSIQNRACFVMGVGGYFHGGGEYLQIFNNNGAWDFRAAAQSPWIYGQVGCIMVDSPSDYTQEYYWAQGQATVTMRPTNSYACFLTGVAGHFVGGGESVTVGTANGYWTLGGSSMQQGVWGAARCVATNHVVDFFTVGPTISNPYFPSTNPPGGWAALEFYSNNPSAFYIQTNNTQTGIPAPFPACFLTRMCGQFDSSGETGLLVSPAGANSQPPYDWMLGLSNWPQWKQMTAGCLRP